MKTRLLFIALAIGFTLASQAQLKVITNGNVGIGTDAPLEKLHINGSLRGDQQAGMINIQTDIGYTRMGSLNTSFSHFYTHSGNFYFDKGVDSRTGQFTSYTGVDLLLCTSSNFNTRMTISNTNGNVGIGRSPHATAKLDVAGDIAVNGTIKVTSDIRFKENIKPMDASFNKLASLQPITFNYTKDLNQAPVAVSKDSADVNTGWQEVEDAFTKTVRYGFSAQEVQKIYPDLVTEDTDGRLSVDYMGLIPILVQAMKEQQATIDDLKAQIAAIAAKE